MHLTDFHPKHPVFLGLALMLLVMLSMLVAAPDAGTLDFSLGGSSAPAGQPATTTPTPEPTWLTDPLASPLERW
jgi:hypothetical protein